MPLSLNKLASFLLKKDFIPIKYFRYNGNCIFLEIVSLTLGVTSMIYVPSRFIIPISPGENVIELEIVDMDDLSPDEYNKDPMRSPEDIYSSVDLSPGNGSGNAEELLQLKYKKTIDLKSGKNTSILKDIVRQLNRLQHCVEGLPYYLVIYQNNYMVYMRDNEADCFIFKDKNFRNIRSLRVVTPMNLIYERGDLMNSETSQISSGIQKILDKNMVSHAKFLNELISRKGNLLNFASLMNKKKQAYDILLEKYKGLLEKLDTEEKDVKSQQKKFSDLRNDSSFDSELNRGQIRADFERKLQHFLIVKQKIIDNIISIQTASESLSLQADKILYDNSVMMDKIFKNFSMLIDMSK